jgi:hypothetical protein
VPAQRLAAFRAVVRLFFGTLAAGVVAGAVAGLGARIAMLVIALMNHSHDGEVTHANFAVGRITAEGTVNVIVTGALLFGLPGAVLYLVVRPWLPERTVARAGAFSLLLIAIASTAFLQDNGYEYVRYVSPAVSVPMFLALFPLYGMVVTALGERLGRGDRRPFGNRLVRVGGRLALSVVVVIGGLDVISRLRIQFA